MRMDLALIILSVFFFDASFISLTKAEWKCSFETTENCFLDLVPQNGTIWKRLNSSYGETHFDRKTYPAAAKGNFYLYHGLNLHVADSGRRRQLDSIQLKEMKACLGFYFYIYGRGVKTLRILNGDGNTIWNYSEHTHSWNFTETDIELSHTHHKKFYIDVEDDDSNVVFALDEMTLRNGYCNATYSTSVEMSKSENGFQTESSRAISSMGVVNNGLETSSDRTRKKEQNTQNSEFETESFITTSSRPISSMTDVNGGLETSSDRTRKKENGTQPGEIKNESTSAISTMDTVNGGLPTSLEIEFQSSLTGDINTHRKGNLVGIGLGTAIAVLLLLVGVAIYAKRRIGAKESNENGTSNERTDVQMHSHYEDILEQGLPSRREDREAYDLIPENNDAGIHAEEQGQPSRQEVDREAYDVIPENNDTGIYTEVTPVMPVYDTASMETCIYKHLNEVQDDDTRTSVYGDFPVYNILSLKPSTKNEMQTDQEYDCMSNIKK